MSLVTTIGYIRSDLESLREWCIQQSATEQTIVSRYAFGRTHKWFGYDVRMTKRPKITQGYRDYRVARLGDLLVPGWDCALLCHYRPRACMTAHRDHRVFEPRLVLVNVGYAKLRVGNHDHYLQDGQVISFDSNHQHELYPVPAERWSLIFRKIRSEYLPA